jgi:hypothetical protein
MNGRQRWKKMTQYHFMFIVGSRLSEVRGEDEINVFFLILFLFNRCASSSTLEEMIS